MGMNRLSDSSLFSLVDGVHNPDGVVLSPGRVAGFVLENLFGVVNSNLEYFMLGATVP